MNNNRRYSHILLLTAFLLLGAAVRLPFLAVESIDLEEYACVGGLHAPDWHAYFDGQRILYPYGAPLAPALNYLWSGLVGVSIARIRLLYALISIATIPLCYGVAAMLFQDRDARHARRAGLVAALCFTLSPVHVFHAQEARMYALVSLFTLVSAGALCCALRGNAKRWWTLHIIANAGLLASHYFTVFFFPVLGLAVLLWDRRLSRRAIAWGVAQSALALLLLLWVSRIPPQAEDLYSYYERPELSTAFIHLLAGDSATLSANSFSPSQHAWAFIPETLRSGVFRAHFLFDVALATLSLLALFGAVTSLKHGFRVRNRRDVFIWGALLLWALLPVGVILAISFTWRPIYGSRYVMYSVFALYFMMGGLLGGVRSRGRFTAALVSIAIVYTYQLSIALPPQTRTGWRQALETMADQSGDRAFLALEDAFWLPVLHINGPVSVPVSTAYERGTLCDMAATMTPWLKAEGLDMWALLVLTTDFDETPFAACIKERGWSWERVHFPGERGLALYRIPGTADAPTQDPGAYTLFRPVFRALLEPERASAVDAFETDIRYQRDDAGGAWLRMGLALARHGYGASASTAWQHAVGGHGANIMALLAFAETLETSLDAEALTALALASGANCASMRPALLGAYYGRAMDRLERLGNALIRLQPDCAEGYAALGLAHHLREEHAAAIPRFAQAHALDARLFPECHEAYGASLTTIGQYDAAISLLEEGVHTWPDYHWMAMRLGIALAAAERHAEAVEAFQQALAPTPADWYIASLLLDSQLALGAYASASATANLESLATREEHYLLRNRWRAYAGAGNDTMAAVVLAQLAEHNDDVAQAHAILYGRRDPESARELLRKAEQLGDPSARELALTIERMLPQ